MHSSRTCYILCIIANSKEVRLIWAESRFKFVQRGSWAWQSFVGLLWRLLKSPFSVIITLLACFMSGHSRLGYFKTCHTFIWLLGKSRHNHNDRRRRSQDGRHLTTEWAVSNFSPPPPPAPAAHPPRRRLSAVLSTRGRIFILNSFALCSLSFFLSSQCYNVFDNPCTALLLIYFFGPINPSPI